MDTAGFYNAPVRPLPLLALFAACAGERVRVDRQPGLDGSWGQGAAQLDVTGSTATLAFHGRLFVFEGVGPLRGSLGEDEVVLAGGGVRIRVDAERVVVAEGGREVVRPLAELPRGSRHVWRDGDLRPG
jgi:hypothetical protein